MGELSACLFLHECPAPSVHGYTPEGPAEAINLMDMVIRNYEGKNSVLLIGRIESRPYLANIVATL